jgi:hypothetical protein
VPNNIVLRPPVGKRSNGFEGATVGCRLQYCLPSSILAASPKKETWLTKSTKPWSTCKVSDQEQERKPCRSTAYGDWKQGTPLPMPR